MSRDPLVWPALACVVGVWLFPHWEPSGLDCAVGALLCAALGLRSRLGVVAAAFWLGSGLPAATPEGPTLRGQTAVSGTLLLTWGTQGLVQRPDGTRVLLQSPTPLRSGLPVHAFGTARPVWTAALPGEPDPELFARTARVDTRLVARAVDHPSLPDPPPLADHGGLLHALSTGDRSHVPEPVLERFRRTGTLHVMAVSGLHVGLLAGAVLALGKSAARAACLVGLEPPRWVFGVVALALVLLFGAVVGWPISTRRAAAMVAGALLAQACSRRLRPWNLLALAAMVTVLAEPSSVRTLSMQLSFGAVAGVLALRGPPRAGLLGWLEGSIRATVGATLGTLPAMAWSLQELPVTGVLANLVAVPAVGLMLPCTLLHQATGWLLPLAFADSTAAGLLWALEHLEGPVLHPAVGPLGAAALSLAIVAPRGRWALLLLGLTLRSYGVDRASFLSVGQGDAALLEGSERVLVDGGPPGDRLLRYLRRRGIHRLDRVVVSHAHPDHTGGLLPVLRELPVDEVQVPRLPAPGEDRTLLRLAVQQGARIVVGGALHPSSAFLAEHEDLNDGSRVHLEHAGGRSILFTGDIEAAGEAAVDWPRAEVLKVPHHGSRSSSTPALLEAVRPSLAVIGCGVENRFGHPHPEVLRRYAGVRVLRTDVHGTVQLDEGGVRVWRPGAGWRRL